MCLSPSGLKRKGSDVSAQCLNRSWGVKWNRGDLRNIGREIFLKVLGMKKISKMAI
jgi:hypothetical protein